MEVPLSFALVRFGNSRWARFCLQTLGLHQHEEDTLNRTVTYSIRCVLEVIEGA